MANQLYDIARYNFARGLADWQNDVFWIVLLNSTYVVDLTAHRTYSQIDPAARLSDVGPIANRTVDEEGYCLGGPVSVQRITTNTQATQAVIYKKHVGEPDLDYPVLHLAQVGGLPLRFNRDFYRIDWADSRIFRL